MNLESLATYAHQFHTFSNDRYFSKLLNAFEQALVLLGYEVSPISRPPRDLPPACPHSNSSLPPFELECVQVALAKANVDFLYPRAGDKGPKWSLSEYTSGYVLALAEEFLECLPTQGLRIDRVAADSIALEPLEKIREGFKGDPFDAATFQEVLKAIC